MEVPRYVENSEKLLTYRNRLSIPNVRVLKQTMLDEYKNKTYASIPGYQKMITTLRK